MFTFLNSAILLGLAAVAIPFLIHLFTRQKIKLVQFSSLRFLKELQKQQIRRLKLRQILLLILRALLILFLVLMFSRPALRNTDAAAIGSDAQITAVIILDNTMSMGFESQSLTRLESAKKRAMDVVNQLRLGDEIHLVYPQSPPVIPHEGARYNLDSIRELIEQTEMSFSKTDYLAALSLADNIMSGSSNINKEVYLIADLQKNGFSATADGNGARWLADGIRLFVIPVTGRDAPNLSLVDVQLANQILEKGKVVEVEASVRNTSANAIRDKLVHLFVNGKRVGQNAVDVESNSAAKIVFRFVPDLTGQQSGMALLEDDALLADNRRYFSFTIPDEISVLMVGSQPGDAYFLNLALQPQKDVSTFIKIKTVLYKDFAAQNLEDYGMVVLANLPKIENSEGQTLQNFLAAGGGLMVLLGPNVDLRAYNENLHRKLNLPALTNSFVSSGDQQLLSFGNIDFSHPIFQEVFEEEKNVDSPHFRFAIQVAPQPLVDKIIEFSNGSPFLFESKYRKGRILYFTSGVSSDWSDLAFRGIFAPLMNRSVSYLARATDSQSSEFIIGEEVRYSPDGNLQNPNLVVEEPEGEQVQIKPEIAQGKYQVRFNENRSPGIYKLLDGQNTLTQWSVNFDASESELTPAEMSDVIELVETKEVFVISGSDDMAQKLSESRFGRELWKFFAAAALLVLLLEMTLFRERAEKQK
jgi:hypothetical protein